MTEPNSLEGAAEELVIQVRREVLLQHLRRIRLNSVADVVFEGPFRAKAMSSSGDLAVATAGLSDIESLPAPVGVKLKPLIGTLDCLQGDEIEVRLEGDRLVFACGNRRIRLQTIEPHLTGTQVDPQRLAGWFAKITDWQMFNPDICKGVVQAIRGLGAEVVIIRVGPDGMTFIVGDPRSHSVEFDLPDLTEETSYGVFIPACHVQGVFAEVGDSQPAIGLSGANGLVGLRHQTPGVDGDSNVEVAYVISPMEGTGGSDGRLPRPQQAQAEPLSAPEQRWDVGA